MERAVREELAPVLARSGSYGEAASEWTAELRQTIEFGRGTQVKAHHNSLGSWNVPVIVNAKSTEWIFDTGANYWVMTDKDPAVRRSLTDSRYEDGSIGIDAPADGFTLDLRAMQLRVA
ncbi:MAG TPA: hypothetical protein VHZ74_01325 [Bryobacteraceae bacterium]|nr:hypothetical protein [Bryobacteraceae bacterium]